MAASDRVITMVQEHAVHLIVIIRPGKEELRRLFPLLSHKPHPERLTIGLLGLVKISPVQHIELRTSL